jgi:hypothetical protein
MIVCLVAALPALCAASAAAMTFTPPVHYGLGGRPADLVAVDLDGDGRLDLVTSAGSGVDVLLGRSLGRFAAATRVAMEHRPGALVAADLDANGTPDVVTANRDGTVSVLLGDGAGGFAAMNTYPTGAAENSDVAVADFDGDGFPDVAAAVREGLSILMGDGSGGLLAPSRLDVGEGCRRVVAGDFDLDGSPDLVCTRNLWDEYAGVGVLLGDGTGGFAPMVYYRTRLEPYELAPCDFNGDRLPDLAALSTLEGSADVDAFFGDGLGILIRGYVMSVGGLYGNLSVAGFATGDLDRNGLADVVTTGYDPGAIIDGKVVPPGPGRIYLLLGHRFDGVFLERQSFAAGRRAGAVIVADFNGDRKADLATTDLDYRSLSVRLQGALPVLTGVSPVSGRVGVVVTLTGRHFSLRGVVRFGATTATAYLSRSPSLIKVRVPAGTAKGRVGVTVTTLVGRTAPKPFVRL